MHAGAQLLPIDDDPIAGLIEAGELREAIARCVSDHGAAIGRLCMAMLGSQADAEEVTQETFMAAHASMSSYRGDGTVRAWLFGIARRQCARRLERRSRHQRKLELVPADPTAAGPDGSFARKRRAAAIRAALAKLKPTERETLLLRFHAGLSFKEIAIACGIEEAAARKRASRGLQRLRSVLEPEDVE